MKTNEMKERMSIPEMILEVLYVGNRRSLPNGSEVITLRVADRYNECNLDCYKENISIAEGLRVGDMIILKQGWCKHYVPKEKTEKFAGWDITTGKEGKIEKV